MVSGLTLDSTSLVFFGSRYTVATCESVSRQCATPADEQAGPM